MDDLVTRIEAELPALRRYATVLTQDADRADDLAQDCVARALERRRLWRRPHRLRAWLFTIMRRIHSNQMRALSRGPTTLPLDEDRHVDGAADAPSRHAELQETVDAMWRLAPEQREVLVLVVVEGLRYREVAAVLDVPVGTVMSRLSRARERLRHQLDRRRRGRLREVK